ncbi:hypothetical protein [Geodermatophilus sp. DF01_2]|nr:hypothetical protein [Geodermatophilus sp. DF01_2]
MTDGPFTHVADLGGWAVGGGRAGRADDAVQRDGGPRGTVGHV